MVMNGVTNCLICEHKLRSFLFGKNNGNYIQRVCSDQTNHSLSLIIDNHSKDVKSIKFSMNPDYSVFINLDLHEGKTYIIQNDNPPIIINRLIDVDFKNMSFVREQVNKLLILK